MYPRDIYIPGLCVSVSGRDQRNNISGTSRLSDHALLINVTETYIYVPKFLARIKKSQQCSSNSRGSSTTTTLGFMKVLQGSRAVRTSEFKSKGLIKRKRASRDVLCLQMSFLLYYLL